MQFGYRSRVSAGIFAISGALLSVQAVSAETLPVAGIYPAANSNAAALNSIAIEDFGGDRGASLNFAIYDNLEGAVVYGEPYFELFAINTGEADAILRGSANSEVVETELDDRKVVTCLKEDKENNCLKKKTTFYACSRLDTGLNLQIRLIGADGRELYRKRDGLSASADYCADDEAIPSSEIMLDSLANAFARAVRYDLAPVYRDQTFRVLESRKGMKRDAKKAFRNAVKLTKRDVVGACDSFVALEHAHPDHVSVLFNIGLCLESAGQLVQAADYYRRALVIEPGKDYPEQGLRRIAQRELANIQLNMRNNAQASD